MMKPLELLRKAAAHLTHRAGILFMHLLLRPRKRNDLQLLGGTTYGGWVVPITLLARDAICYCAGVGEDISFDLELAKRFKCQVFAFDPTPRAIEHIRQNASDLPGFHFFDYGLWSSEANMKFYAPRNPQHVSHSILNLQRTKDFFIAPCKRLSLVMEELGHSRLDLLKLDIEGAEYEVIKSIIEDNLDIKVLCVEFDQPMSIRRIIRTVHMIRDFSYSLVNIDRWDYTFVKNVG